MPPCLSTPLQRENEVLLTASNMMFSPVLVKSSLVQSMTLSAPRDFTRSTFAALHTTVTSAPKYFASCIALVLILAASLE